MPAERSKKSPQVRLYVLVTLAFAFALAWAVVNSYGTPDWKQVAFFWTLYALTLLDRIEVPVERLSILRDERPRGVVLSPGFVVLMTAAYATSPSTAVAVALIPALPSLLKAEDRDATKLVFNSGQEAIYVGLASMVFDSLSALDGVLLAFGAAALAAIVALGLNTVFVAGVVALDRGLSPKDIVRRMTWTVPHSIAFGLIALMVATLYVEFGPVAAVFLFMPLAALRFARQAKVGLDAARERTLTEFVRAVDAKDPYTSRHSERVAAICVELHRELGAKPAFLEKRWSAALLHDIGKVAVPAEILGKPGALTPEEYDVIKEHPGLGADVVERIDIFRELAPEVRYHHERLDGDGYPSGLIGDMIPYEARVLAVADAFEALTSDRPYRRGLLAAAALAELQRSAGRHHDPEIVAALRRVLDRGVAFLLPERVIPARAPSAVGQR